MLGCHIAGVHFMQGLKSAISYSQICKQLASATCWVIDVEAIKLPMKGVLLSAWCMAPQPPVTVCMAGCKETSIEPFPSSY